jgi:KTSC domain
MKKIDEKVTYDSTTILSSEYVFATEELIVTFKAGVSYKYYDVTLSDYNNFSTSDSVGREFALVIKPKRFDKLN